jgi:hypothetical protein
MEERKILSEQAEVMRNNHTPVTNPNTPCGQREAVSDPHAQKIDGFSIFPIKSESINDRGLSTKSLSTALSASRQVSGLACLHSPAFRPFLGPFG